MTQHTQEDEDYKDRLQEVKAKRTFCRKGTKGWRRPSFLTETSRKVWKNSWKKTTIFQETCWIIKEGKFGMSEWWFFRLLCPFHHRLENFPGNWSQTREKTSYLEKGDKEWHFLHFHDSINIDSHWETTWRSLIRAVCIPRKLLSF